MNGTTDDMQRDYSELFARQTPVRGKYFEQAMRAKRMVEIDSDVLQAFPTAKELNAALRSLIAASRHVHLKDAS
ncbi:hypothetical protein [Allofranklinella schreckenbergeri]|nr:hypothetical protein [Allofranklinella schreckenbergeri]RRD40558.1 hypothetical protein EII18_11265 [Comamonadaceae bacterium OH3737_COT-264]